MRIGRSIVVSLVICFLLALTARYAGLGWPMGAAFFLLFCLTFPVVLHSYVTAERPAPAGSPEGTSNRPALMPVLAANVAMTIFYLMLAYAYWPVVTATLNSEAPRSYGAILDLMSRNDAAAEQMIRPLDTGMIILTTAQRDEATKKLNTEYAAQLKALNEKRPADITSAAGIEWINSVANKKNDYERSLKMIDEAWRSNNVPAQPPQSPTWYDSFVTLHWALRAAILLLFLWGVADLIKALSKEGYKGIGGALGFITLAIVALCAGIWAMESDDSISFPSFNLSASSLNHSDPNGWGRRAGKYIDSDNMTYENPWIPTEYVLEKNNPLRLEVFNFKVHNRGQMQCSSSGCLEPQLGGRRFRDDFRDLAVVARIGDHEEAIYIGSGRVLTADEFGEGQLSLSVNQIRRTVRHDGTLDPAPEAWEELIGGYNVLVERAD
jgi:hypothetical protein